MADLLISKPEKVCTKCLVSKPKTAEFFTVRNDAKCGYVSRCKMCVAEVGRVRWSDPGFHADALRRRKIKYATPEFQEKESLRWKKRKADPSYRAREAERQKRRESDPLYQQKEIERGQRRRQTQEYKDRVREYGKKYYAANAARSAELRNAWYRANREKLREKRSSPSSRARMNKWLRNHLKKNPHLRVIRNVGVAISEILKEGRIVGCFRFLPYNKIELRTHLERQFSSGMTWKNYGTHWHVDHIVPQASFRIDPDNPTDCPEFQACWALTNLRPLWKHDNQVKSAKRTYLL